MDIPYWEALLIRAGTFVETITAYRGAGGSQFMAQLRAAVTACAKQQLDGETYQHRLLTATARGDESILIKVTRPEHAENGEPTGHQEVRLVSVVRLRDVVMVLLETGWEGGSSEPATVDHFTNAALLHLRAWHG